MGVRNPKKEVLHRLEAKTLDARFLVTIQEGLGCSPFEARAVLEVVREVYFPFLEAEIGSAPPGKITLVAVDADEPAGKPISKCNKVPVCLSVHRGLEDDRLLQTNGASAFRQKRLPELCQEALSQGALLTREDLAYRIFFVGTRTISRDLALLRKKDPLTPIPLRSTVQDIGPVLTHRVQIVKLALEGKSMTDICRQMRHSPAAVANYVSTFTRCAQLADKKMEVSQIAFLLHRSKGLIQSYIHLLEQCRNDQNLSYHLEELMKLAQGSGGKKSTRRLHYGQAC
jgi:hypothetical protein